MLTATMAVSVRRRRRPALAGRWTRVLSFSYSIWRAPLTLVGPLSGRPNVGRTGTHIRSPGFVERVGLIFTPQCPPGQRKPIPARMTSALLAYRMGIVQVLGLFPEQRILKMDWARRV